MNERLLFSMSGPEHNISHHPRHRHTVFRTLVLSALLLPGLLAVAVQGDEVEPAGRIRVAVFEGDGAGRSCTDLMRVLGEANGPSTFDVVRITPQAIRDGGLSEVDVLIHPGGSGSKQGRALEADGREAVRDFVREGGGFVGICAGAYLATNDYSWSLGLIDAKVVDRKHWARGTGLVTVELSPGAQQFFGSPEKEFEIYYGQGPLLARNEWDDPLVPDYESLAVYRTGIAKKGAPEGVMPGTSAIVRAQYGTGRVFCFSAHPEKTDSQGYLVEQAVRWAARETQAGAGEQALRE